MQDENLPLDQTGVNELIDDNDSSEDELSPEKLEHKKNLLNIIRNFLIKDKTILLSPEDVLSEDVKNLKIEELENVIRNIQANEKNKIKGFASERGILAIGVFVDKVSGGKMTIKTAETDKDLLNDFDELIGSYFGEVPLVGRFLIRLLSHLRYKTEEVEEKQNEGK